MSTDETQLVAVDIADPGQYTLIEQRLGDGPVRIGGQIGGRNRSIPILAQKVGSQMRDDGAPSLSWSSSSSTPRSTPTARMLSASKTIRAR